jgi:hypothetical protein
MKTEKVTHIKFEKAFKRPESLINSLIRDHKEIKNLMVISINKDKSQSVYYNSGLDRLLAVGALEQLKHDILED